MVVRTSRFFARVGEDWASWWNHRTEGHRAMADDDDMGLLRRWRAGDRMAGDTLLRRYYAYALRLAKARLASPDDAKEATQHAMTTLVRKQDEVEDDFRAYLGQVVYYSVLSQTKRLAKQRRHRPFDDTDAGEKKSYMLEPRSRAASTLLVQKQEEKLMIKAMRSLPIVDQLVFYYEFAGDKTRTEIAAQLGLPPGQIYKRVHEAKQRLRKQLERFQDSPARQSTLGGLETWLASMCGKAGE